VTLTRSVKVMNFARLSKWLVGICLSRHGIRQYQSNYADGPAYITQCPIETGGSYIYEFTVNGQRGTFFYHAHINWLRATVHGALIVHPKKGLPARYKDVVEEIPILIGKFIC
jgi:laccase